MWNVDFVLPNIIIDDAFENDYFAISSINDDRVKKIMKENENICNFINNFSDQFQTKIFPSAFLSQEPLPEQIKTIESVVAFRNIFAISTIMRGFETNIPSTGYLHFPIFSDHFDFYNYSISKEQNKIIVNTPGAKGSAKVKYFRGQVSPGLPEINSFSIEDDLLAEKLKKVWERRYAKNKTSEWKTKAIFRALEMAYLASKMPNECAKQS